MRFKDGFKIVQKNTKILVGNLPKSVDNEKLRVTNFKLGNI